MNTLLKVDEVAQMLKKHPETIRIMLRDGTLEGVHVGRPWYVTQESVQKYLEACQNKPDNDMQALKLLVNHLANASQKDLKEIVSILNYKGDVKGIKQAAIALNKRLS